MIAPITIALPGSPVRSESRDESGMAISVAMANTISICPTVSAVQPRADSNKGAPNITTPARMNFDKPPARPRVKTNPRSVKTARKGASDVF